MLRQTLPMLFTAALGLLTLAGLLFVPGLAGVLLGWAGLLAAVALLFGVLNLLLIHGRRTLRERNLYSLVLILSLLAVWAAAAADGAGLTEDSVIILFSTVLQPLEAALASLIALFLLFSGYRLLQRQRNLWSVLFIVTAVLVLLGSTPLPAALGMVAGIFGRIGQLISLVFVTAGMRGILIGVALGSITISLRLLAGRERPYNR